MRRVEEAEKLFHEGYNCSQSVFAAFSDLYGIEKDTALKLSASFGGGVGRMREVCGAVSGMSMVAGLETGSVKQMDDEGKKYNYEVVRKLAEEFRKLSGSIICRELLGLEDAAPQTATPEPRSKQYYNTRPCSQLVKDAAEIIERVLYAVTFESVTTTDQQKEVSALAEEIWHEHYEPILGKAQVNYMVEKFQSEEAIREQSEMDGYQYFLLKCLGGTCGYLAIKVEQDALFLSKFYIAKKFRGRGFARQAMDYLEKLCREKELTKLWLTVNRNNEDSIRIYESLGFKKAGTKLTEIGSGFVMDDYLMEKEL